MAFGIIVYFMMFSNNLVNSYDGLWWFSRYFAGYWERSIGRWFWPYLDMLRFGIVSSVLNGIITLAVISAASIMLAHLFGIKDRKTVFLAGISFTASPLVCDILSYCYMSPTFAVAYLFSVTAAGCVIRLGNTAASVLLGGIFIALTMGNYQAYFSVTCIILLMHLIRMILEQEELKRIGGCAAKSAASVIWGGILYKIITSAVCGIYGMSLSDYKGAANVSVSKIIENMPRRIVDACRAFRQFFSGNQIQNNIFGNAIIQIFLIAVFLVFVAGRIRTVWKQGRFRVLLLLIMVLLIPVACNATLLIAFESDVSLLMTGGMVVLAGIILCMIRKFEKKRVVRAVYITGMCVAVWVNVCVVNNDQLAMLEGRNATVTIAQNIAGRLMEDGYLTEDTTVAFVGRPSDNPLFKQSSAWKMANDYAAFGRWWSKDNCNRHSWNGIFSEYCGLNIKLCMDEVYNRILDSGKIEDMPVFPDEGCIDVICDTLVVKVSNVY